MKEILRKSYFLMIISLIFTKVVAGKSFRELSVEFIFDSKTTIQFDTITPDTDSIVLATKQAARKKKDTTGIWTFTGTSTVSTSQNSFRYWAGGGQSSVAVSTILNAIILFSNQTTNWQNQIDLSYGIMNQESFPGWNKTDDVLSLSSKFGKKASKSLFYSILFNPTTQFQPGFEMIGDSLPISKMLAPLFAETALGFNYVPNSKVDVFLGLGTLKSTLVNDQRLADLGAYGVDAAVYDNFGEIVTLGKKMRNEFGGYLLLQYKNPRILKNVGIRSRLEMFSNYLNNPGNIDIDWQNVINLQINEYIGMNINIQMKYDDDIKTGIDIDGDGQIDKTASKIQLKEVLGVGLNINLGQ